ncbi:MAG TPA: M48 family metallopeptidase, partial [Burkholderiales bacterium]
MNFFEHQSLARRNSRVMVVLFLLSVVAIVLAVNLVVGSVYLLGFAEGPQPVVPMHVYAAGAAVTVAIIAVVSIVNIIALADGGAHVARLLGARAVAPASSDALERRFLNIVEEMAIASGVRLPQAYVMDQERGINAFAAGWSTSGSVIAVTRGTLERLTRDELQAVIGHEFSHILNGDMGLNIRMVGVLAGIVAIGSIGGFLVRLAGQSASDDIRFAAPVFLLGVALFIIGYVGLFFARLIKAAVSRQREFLADASSVQFTRNADSMAGALDQLRASGAGTLIQGRYAEEMSHLFFGQGIKLHFAGLFDTHPPVEERIRRVQPRFQPSSYRKQRSTAVEMTAARAAEAAAAEPPPTGRRAADIGTAWGLSATQSAQLVGAFTSEKLGYAGQLLKAIPPALRESVREPNGASAVLIALLLAPKEEVMREQLQALKLGGLTMLAERVERAAPLTRELGFAFHLAVVDLALPALKAAPEEAKKALIAGLEAVINADRRVSVHEFVVLTFVREQLWARPKPARASRRIAELKAEAGTLLGLVAHAGTRPDASGSRAEALQAALRAGAAVMEIEIPAAGEFAPAAIGAAFEALKNLAPMQKAVLVKGLFAAVSADGTIRVVEAELMRLTAALLDCPLPPLFDELDP